MTDEQTALIQSTWARLLPRRKAVCSDFYRRLLAIHPELASLFGSDLEHQADLFATMLNTIVSALENKGPVHSLIQTLGARHADYGVTAADYVKFEIVLLDTFEAVLGADFDTSARNAWSALYRRLVSTMQAGAASPPG